MGNSANLLYRIDESIQKVKGYGRYRRYGFMQSQTRKTFGASAKRHTKINKKHIGIYSFLIKTIKILSQYYSKASNKQINQKGTGTGGTVPTIHSFIIFFNPPK